MGNAFRLPKNRQAEYFKPYMGNISVWEMLSGCLKTGRLNTLSPIWAMSLHGKCPRMGNACMENAFRLPMQPEIKVYFFSL